MRSCHECGLRYSLSESFCHVDGARLLDSEDELLGATLGKYRVVRLLGAGGMGQVYLGLNPQIGSRVAIKVLSEKAAADKDLVQRFFREAQLVNKIRHENIVNVFDFDELADGRPYLTMECLAGEPMSAIIARGPMPVDRVVAIALEMLEPLQVAHDAGVVHRDLKPDNVFISPQGRVKLLDFGIAKLMPSYDATAMAVTKTGFMIGTPGYMAPEQILDEPISPRTDVYAMGAILYESLTGRLAFHKGSLFEVLRKIVSEPPGRPSELRSELSAGFDNLILKAMAKKPAERYGSAAEMAQALRALPLRGSGTSAARPVDPLSELANAATMAAIDTPPLLAALSSPPAPVMAPPPAPVMAPPPPSIVAPLVPEPTERHPRRSARPIYIGAALLLLAGGLVSALLVAGGDDQVKEQETAALAADPVETIAEVGPTDRVIAASPLDASVLPAAEPRRPRAPRSARSQVAAGTPAKPTPVVDAGAASAPPPARAGVTLIETGSRHKDTEIHGKPDFNAAAFDGTGYLARAQKLAKEIYGDAYLVEFEVNGVAPSGHANFAAHRIDATYNFLSPSHAKGRAPIGIEEELPCWVYVEVDKTGFTARIVESDDCKGKKRPVPRCSLKEVWDRGMKLGAPRSGAVAKITYLWDGWFFSIDPLGLAESIPDDC